ncbi:hypothetical protein Taro_036842 [Colocasia esculenta]|uniref:Uncharacterized protein n=1 Tax=Colocasia esculenta TaxID=4460 RepID=A0A843WEI3_COLES|nr:hypothetical protein [Colocasia esculenta]
MAPANALSRHGEGEQQLQRRGRPPVPRVVLNETGPQMPEDPDPLTTLPLAEAVGFMAASTAFDVLYVYCVELFPTNVRNLTVSMLRQALMLRATVVPQLIVLGQVSPKLFFVEFGCLSLFSGALMVWLPETRDAPLYETMEKQESKEKRKLQGSLAGGSEVELPVQDPNSESALRGALRPLIASGDKTSFRGRKTFVSYSEIVILADDLPYSKVFWQ